MSSIVWDAEIGQRLAQLRGEAPTGRVWVKCADGVHRETRDKNGHEYHLGIDACMRCHVAPNEPEYGERCTGGLGDDQPNHAVGAHDVSWHTGSCVHCHATREQFEDNVVPLTYCRGKKGHRPKNWRMTQHLALEKAAQTLQDSAAYASKPGGFVADNNRVRGHGFAGYEYAKFRVDDVPLTELELLLELLRVTQEAHDDIMIGGPRRDTVVSSGRQQGKTAVQERDRQFRQMIENKTAMSRVLIEAAQKMLNPPVFIGIDTAVDDAATLAVQQDRDRQLCIERLGREAIRQEKERRATELMSQAFQGMFRNNNHS